MHNTRYFKNEESQTYQAIKKLKQRAHMRKVQKSKLLNVTPVKKEDFKNVEKQLLGSIRAQAEATNMNKIDI